MAMEIYVKFEGADQGELDAGTLQGGLEGASQVFAVEHIIEVPYNREQGQISGNRLHNPLVVTKAIDKVSPLLRKALCDKETIAKVTLDFYTPNQTMYYSVVLETGYLVAIRTWMPLSLLPENGPVGHMEDIHVAYSKITWTITDGGVEGVDDWFAPILK
jgi:type VI secretion system secreted protein Hcp